MAAPQQQQPSARAKMIALFAFGLFGVGIVSFIAGIAFWSDANSLRSNTNVQAYIGSGLAFLASGVAFGSGLLGLSLIHRA